MVSAAAVAELELPDTDKLVSVPTLVIFGCAAVVRVPAMLVPDRLPLVMLPVTAKLVNVPTLVMLPCAAVVTVPAVVADVADGTVPVTLAPGILVKPAPDPLNWLPVTVLVTDTVVPVCVVAFTLAPPNTLPPVILPVTAKLPSVPTEVMLVCAAVVSVPTMLVPDRLPLVMLPVTAKLVSVPTEVILPCAAVVTVPAVVADVADGTVPVTLAPGIAVRPAPDPLNWLPVTVLVTLTVVPV